MSKLIVQGNILYNHEIHDGYLLICEDGKIVYCGPKQTEEPDLVFHDGLLVPGYIDLHIHGSQGADVMDGSLNSLQVISRSLAKYGVTGFLATTLTAELSHLEQVLRSCHDFVNQSGADSERGAELLGVHLEGPWINSRYIGAQNDLHVVRPHVKDAEKLVAAAGGLLKVITLAPEQVEGDDIIAFLKANGVIVSAGHTDATYESFTQAMNRGLSHVTHCFNAMRGLHHREPGVVGAAMYHEQVTAELIADGIHVHPVVMNILYRLKKAEHLVLVSDGIRAVGMDDGDYDLGGLRVHVKEGVARLSDGTLAGSTLTLEQAVRNMVKLCDVPVSEAIEMATSTPANMIGLGERKGKLATGYDADFLLLDSDLHVIKTFVAGVERFSAKK